MLESLSGYEGRDVKSRVATKELEVVDVAAPMEEVSDVELNVVNVV